MKKIVLAIILVLTLTMLMTTATACGTAGDDYYAPEEENYEVEENDFVVENEENLSMQAAFLEDLDYMLYVLENNFALFDVAHWARGVDIYAIVEDVRAEILANPDMDAHDFYVALDNSFRPLINIGHFWFYDFVQYDYAANNPGSWHRWFFSADALARLRYPHVADFYEQNRDRFPQVGWTGGTVSPNNVIINSIEEGRIAYLSVGSFWWTNFPGSEHDNQILDFFEDIRGYGHLIIDLRNTGGGCASNFIVSMVGPNIEESIRLEGFVFLTHGDYVEGYYERVLTGGSLGPPHMQTRMNSVDRELRPIDELLEEFDLTEFNMADAERLDYGFRMHLDVRARQLPRFDNQPAFDGEIWFLTGPRMGSAIQISSWVAKEVPDFATLVGEVTGGMYGGPRTFVALPNSGIVFNMDVFYITDSHGRPLEAGTIPHYFNREGMDALETVLAMIEEGQY
jgi:hypothetical protein